MPFHWGFAGETVGGNANDLTSLVADPNVSMHEGKVFACEVSVPGDSGAKHRRRRSRAPMADARTGARYAAGGDQPEGKFGHAD